MVFAIISTAIILNFIFYTAFIQMFVSLFYSLFSIYKKHAINFTFFYQFLVERV